MITTSDFIGIRLNAKTDEPKDLDKVIAAINEAVAEFGYKVDTWNEWNKFKEFCVDETKFIDELMLKVCTSAPSAEHSRSSDDDDPCDDGRG